MTPINAYVVLALMVYRPINATEHEHKCIALAENGAPEAARLLRALGFNGKPNLAYRTVGMWQELYQAEALVCEGPSTFLHAARIAETLGL